MRWYTKEKPTERVESSFGEVKEYAEGSGFYKPFLASPDGDKEALRNRASDLEPKNRDDVGNRWTMNTAILARALARDVAYQQHCWRKAKTLSWHNHHRAVYERSRKEKEFEPK